MGRLTTHVLDTASGIPARGMKLSLFSLKGASRSLIKSVVTNSDGRCDSPLLDGQALLIGTYEIVFSVQEYFLQMGAKLPTPNFLGEVPIRFSIANPTENFHVPLLVSPWSYSTYRGS